jgi:hypothetical protein
VPAAQLVHAPALRSEYLPMGHGVHAVAPMPEYVPAGHGLAACALETELPLHFERSSLPDQVDGQTEPAAQSTQRSQLPHIPPQQWLPLEHCPAEHAEAPGSRSGSRTAATVASASALEERPPR